MSNERAEPTGKAGRYQRSAAGLVVSLVVTVVGIGALLYFMGLFRPDFEAKPEAIDYLPIVEDAQTAGLTPAYPPTLPKGWIATGVDVVPGDRPVFMLRLLTDDDRFVAVRLEDASVGALLSTWVDENTEVADGYAVPGTVKRPVARDWKGYRDSGGDSALAAELKDTTVLVFGSAPRADLEEVVDALVTTPVAQSSSSS